MPSSPFFLLLAACLPLAGGQSRTRDAASSELMQLAAALPSCGLACVETSFLASGCTEVSCMCTDADMQEAVTVCVLQSCPVTDQLATKNATTTACGATPRNGGRAYDILSITLGSVSGAVLLLRMGHRFAVARAAPTREDWCLLATVAVGAAGTAMTSRGVVANGLGRDAWTLTPRQLTAFAYWFYFMEWTYFLELCALKMSLLFFYLHIFPARRVRRLLWATIAYNAAWGVAFVLVALLQCRPVRYFWTGWAGTARGECLNANAIGWANGVTSIVLDVWMLAIPLAQLRTLQLHYKKKIGVAIMFCTGTFVTVISIVRLHALTRFGSSSNPTWDNLPVSQWSTIEVNVGIICASMPSLRLLLLRAFPRLAGTTTTTTTHAPYGAYDDESTPSWGDKSTGPRSRRARRGYVAVRAGGGGGAAAPPARPAITYQRSYTVHFHDDPRAASASARALVPLRELDAKGCRLSEAFVIPAEQDSSPTRLSPTRMGR